MREIGVVKREFARVLGGMYHARVEYPKAVASREPSTV
jgi:membrane-associated HD superfamily phosphohydrolase